MSSVNIETMLYDEIGREFDELENLKIGSDEHRRGVADLTELVDRAIEMEKVESDCREKEEARKSEELFRQQQLKDERRDRVVKNIISAAGVVLPLAVTIWGAAVSMKFEEEGTFTTIMGRGFINKLLPKK